MSKRTRGTARPQHRRPGARPTTPRSPARQRDADSRRRELDDALLIDETIEPEALSADGPEAVAPAAAARASTATEARATRAARAHQRIKPGSLLASRAATEYVYVTQDLKRITLVGGLIFGALIALWLLIVVLRLIELPFY